MKQDGSVLLEQQPAHVGSEGYCCGLVDAAFGNIETMLSLSDQYVAVASH